MKRQHQETMDDSYLIDHQGGAKKTRQEESGLDGSPWSLMSDSPHSMHGEVSPVHKSLVVDTSFTIPDDDEGKKEVRTAVPSTSQLKFSPVATSTSAGIKKPDTPFPRAVIRSGIRRRKEHVVNIHDSMWQRCPATKKDGSNATIVFAIACLALLVFCFVFHYEVQPEHERGAPGIMELPREKVEKVEKVEMPTPLSTELLKEPEVPAWFEKSENISCRRHRLRGGQLNTDCVFHSKPSQMVLQPDLLRMK